MSREAQEDNALDEGGKAPSYADAATEPVDMAAAFRALNQANQATAQGDVEPSGEHGQDGPGLPEDAAQPVEGDEGGLEEGVDAGAEAGSAYTSGDGGLDGDGYGDGGPADVIEPVDSNAVRKSILEDIQRNAIMQTRKEFADEGIETYNINELYQRDERTGRVTFLNPDDPDRPFASRAEAQAWCNAFNEQLAGEFRRAVNAKQRELVQQQAPRLAVAEFIPKYNAMSKTEKEVFDDLIEDYAINDANGNVVGYNVNLDSAARQAKRIASRYETQASNANATGVQAKKEAEPTQPAMDMRTGTGSSDDEREPKTLAEALKRVDKIKQSKKKEK